MMLTFFVSQTKALDRMSGSASSPVLHSTQRAWIGACPVFSRRAFSRRVALLPCRVFSRRVVSFRVVSRRSRALLCRVFSRRCLYYRVASAASRR